MIEICNAHISMIISFVLATFSTRLFSLHQPTRCSTSLLYTYSSFPEISPTTVVSSANIISRFPSYLDTQSCVISANNSRLRTQWGLEMVFPNTDRLRSVSQKVQDPQFVFRTSKRSFSVSFCEVMMLNAELKSMHRCLCGPDG